MTEATTLLRLPITDAVEVTSTGREKDRIPRKEVRRIGVTSTGREKDRITKKEVKRTGAKAAVKPIATTTLPIS
jgi:hypothetical protein